MSTQPLSVPDAIRRRRTTKKFKADPIPEATLKELVDLTVAAPSSYNLQPWRIVMVTDPGKRAALAKAAWNQSQVATAPVTFVFAVDVRGWEKTLEQTLATGAESGAWNEKTIAYFRTAIPSFQNSLTDKLREYPIKDALIAATHLALAAESLGLNSAFMNGWQEEAVKEVIGAKGNPDIAIALLMPIGYGDGSYGHAGRLPQSATVFQNELR
ncbi:MAG TPA: nitroreductase family protein [Candidatus Methylacidiphilales bacterium]|jgi:nitroreductase|nr:nitroreductase family protein [Candidatus Methylacidiphilales bacterium]